MTTTDHPHAGRLRQLLHRRRRGARAALSYELRRDRDPAAQGYDALGPAVRVHAERPDGQHIGWLEFTPVSTCKGGEGELNVFGLSTSESFAIFAARPDLFAALSRELPETVPALLAILTRLGATERPPHWTDRR